MQHWVQYLYHVDLLITMSRSLIYKMKNLTKERKKLTIVISKLVITNFVTHNCKFNCVTECRTCTMISNSVMFFALCKCSWSPRASAPQPVDIVRGEHADLWHTTEIWMLDSREASLLFRSSNQAGNEETLILCVGKLKTKNISNAYFKNCHDDVRVPFHSNKNMYRR